MSPKNHEDHEQDSDPNSFSNSERNQKKYDTLNDGTAAFMKWMNSSDKKSLTSDNPIVLIARVNGNLTLLYDTAMSMPVHVKLYEGALFCKFCKSDDCVHVGFTIRLNQMITRTHNNEEMLDDVTDDGIGT